MNQLELINNGSEIISASDQHEFLKYSQELERENTSIDALADMWFEVDKKYFYQKAVHVLYAYKSWNKIGKEKYGTIEKWSEEVLGFEKRRLYQLVDASIVLEIIIKNKLKTKSEKFFTALPEKESHCQPLVQYKKEPEKVTAIWEMVEKAVESDQKPKLTAKLVTEAVQEFEYIASKQYFTLKEWEEKPFDLIPDKATKKTFNSQDTDSIEWARWSWNPVTGCKHDCSYCYARDIANRFYTQGFEPSIYPQRLGIPYNMNVPEAAETDVSFKNVFTCSMADLFGRWVPAQWIESVLQVVAENPQWNFLFLTKFPKRMAEFDIPKNAWMGTTVDCQARVSAAEKAFANVNCDVKWLSIEPMLEDIRFEKLDLFDWVVMGGSSPSNLTPGWAPPFDWVVNLHNQARAAGCMVYQKTNLFSGENGNNWISRLREWPGEPSSPYELPDAFKYMKSIK